MACNMCRIVLTWQTGPHVYGLAPEKVRECCTFLDAVQQGCSSPLLAVPLLSIAGLRDVAFAVAIWNDHKHTVRALLRMYGASAANAPQRQNLRPITQAALHGATGAVTVLVQGKVDIEGVSWSRTALRAAADHGHSGTVSKLLALKADVKGSCQPLCDAIDGGHVDTVSLLLEAKSHVNATCSKPPLHHAAVTGRVEIVALLLEAKADIEDSHAGRRALDTAAWCGHAGVVSRLLEAKSRVNHVSCFGRTPLVYAVGDEGCVSALLAGKANVNFAHVETGETALHEAVRRPEYVSTVAVLLGAKADVTKTDKWGRTPLACAKERNCTDSVALLVAGQADVARTCASSHSLVQRSCEIESGKPVL